MQFRTNWQNDAESEFQMKSREASRRIAAWLLETDTPVFRGQRGEVDDCQHT
jgi:hypothetical protein